MRIIRLVEQRVHKCLGWEGLNWRVQNACRPCCYKVSSMFPVSSCRWLMLLQLQDEPPLRFSRLICMDGNNSLKRMKTVGGRTRADTRTLEDSDYFLPATYVDQYMHEVRGKKVSGPQIGMEDRDEEDSDHEDELDGEDEGEGDPTDGFVAATAAESTASTTPATTPVASAVATATTAASTSTTATSTSTASTSVGATAPTASTTAASAALVSTTSTAASAPPSTSAPPPTTTLTEAPIIPNISHTAETASKTTAAPNEPTKTTTTEDTDVQERVKEAIGACVKNWKAASAEEKKRTWDIFDECGIFAAACRHGMILWLIDMVRSGEL